MNSNQDGEEYYLEGNAVKMFWSIGGSLLLMFAVGSAFAQRAPSTVQLPTFHSFGVWTTVSVPDSGSGFLGGSGRAQSGYDEFGAPYLPLRTLRNAAIGSNRAASGAYVSATIHDLRALDELVLSQSTTQYGRPTLSLPAPLGERGQGAVLLDDSVVGRDQRSRLYGSAGRDQRLARYERPVEIEAFGPAWDIRLLPSVNDSAAAKIEQIRSERRQQRETRQNEAEELFERGLTAEEAGKMGVARVCYQMAARRASGELLEKIQAHQASMSGKPTPADKPR